MKKRRRNYVEDPNEGVEFGAQLYLHQKSDQVFDEMCNSKEEVVLPTKEDEILKALQNGQYPLQNQDFTMENTVPTMEELKKNNKSLLFRVIHNCCDSLPKNCWSKDTIFHFANGKRVSTFIREYFPNLSLWLDDLLPTKIFFAILILMDSEFGKPGLVFKKGHWRELATPESLLNIVETIHNFDKNPKFTILTGLKIIKLKQRVFHVEPAFFPFEIS